MKSATRFIYGLIFLTCFIVPTKSYASHCAGGELLYEWISDSTYRVILKFYRDCSGIQAATYEQLCITNSCNSTVINRTLKLLDSLPDGSPNGRVVLGGCPNYGNKCTNWSSSIPGYDEWWYDDTVKLSKSCTNWKFSVALSGARNSSINLGGGGTLYLEATLNTTGSQHNNSPVFSIKPVPYCLVNFPYNYNNGVIDKDGDSLVFENIGPMTGAGCNSGIAMNFVGASPPLNITNNPFQTNNTYQLDSTSGRMNFIPSIQGAQATTIKVREYRNGILVGTVMRDVQIQVLTGSNPDSTKVNVKPLATINCVYRRGNIYACVNKNSTFCFNTLSSNVGGQLIVTDNHTNLFSVGNVTYNKQATNNVEGCYSFTTPSTPQQKNLLVMVKDSTCKPPTGIIFYQVFTIPIIISDTVPKLSVIKSYTYCQGDTATSLIGTGTALLWYYKDDLVNGFNNITPQTDKQGVFTYYAEANNGCYSVWDTITVNVLPKAEAKIEASTDTVCLNESIAISNKLYRQGISYQWNTDNASVISNNADEILNLKWNTKGLKKIKLYAYNIQCDQSDSVYIYVTDVITSGSFNMKSTACVKENVPITLNIKNNRPYVLQTEDTTLVGQTEKDWILSWRNAGKKYVTLMTQVEGCINRPYSSIITINPKPNAEIRIVGEVVCAGEKIELLTEKQEDCIYEWQPLDLFDDSHRYTTRLANGIFETKTISLTVTNVFYCTNTDSIELSPRICCRFMLPNAFTPNGDGLNDKFGVISFMSVTEYDLIITNRWGQVVFRSNNVSSKWDGTFNNKQQDNGTYNYFISYKCLGQTTLNKERGSLQLIR